MDQVLVKLEQARRDLIDQTLRNPLLNYRTLRARGIDVVDASSTQLFKTLVVDAKSFTFLSDPERDEAERRAAQRALTDATAAAPQQLPASNGSAPVSASDALPTYESNLALPTEIARLAVKAPETKVVTVRQKNSNVRMLQTLYSTKELDSRLLKSADAARTHIEEQGINILYLALGQVTWYEEDESTTPHIAPLVLVPVVLARKDIHSIFTLSYSGAGVDGNISLREKMKSDFGLVVPLPLDDLEDDVEIDIKAYCEKVRQAVQRKKRWSVSDDTVRLGFFSFGKFRMYLDLDPSIWPAGHKPTQNPIVSKLLGNGFGGGLVSGVESLDREQFKTYLTLNGNRNVVDADGSQSAAIVAARGGRTIAIQGPPGTGKSQTIANIIAELVAEKKRVLFVAEKSAALEVVKRRLDKVGIGDMCLELHSHKANKANVLEELRRVLALGRPGNTVRESMLSEYESTVQRLNTYDDEVHALVKNTGVAPFDAFGELIALQDKFANVRAPDWSLPSSLDWSPAEYQTRRRLVEDLQRVILREGLPMQNPFWGARTELAMPAMRSQVGMLAVQLAGALRELSGLARQLSNVARLDAPETLAAIDRSVKIAANTAAIPRGMGVDLVSDGWIINRAAIEEAIGAGKEFAAGQNGASRFAKPEIWQADLRDLRERIVKGDNSFWARWGSSYRKAVKQLAALLFAPAPAVPAERLQLIDHMIHLQGKAHLVLRNENMCRSLLGSLWNGLESDFDLLERIARACVFLKNLERDGYLPPGYLQDVQATPVAGGVDAQITQTAVVQGKVETLCAELFTLIELNESERFGTGGLFAAKIEQNIAVFDSWSARTEELVALSQLNIVRRELANVGLESLYLTVANWLNAGDLSVSLFDRNWFQQIAHAAMNERRSLASFDGIQHESRRVEFGRMDLLTLQNNREGINKKHYEGFQALGVGIAGQAQVLHAELNKKRRHKPIRRLFEEAHNAIQALKPVFMMSPMSVASFLVPGAVEFDVVLFDEASQIRPADALGSLLRASQAIVVGDSRQLPPTSFFDAITGNDEDEESLGTTDLESVLGLFNSQGVKNQMLRWHYRSEHQSLIAISNLEFYDNKLQIVPSPKHRSQDLGLRYHHLPQTWYEPSPRGYNLGEARAVAHAILEHARKHPTLTLGVAAFGTKQRDQIEAELELLRRQDASGEAYFQSHTNEPFFIKNLESVQGDERDVVFISIGYGKDRDGKLRMNFGPLNNAGGERRLNVLITRARMRCEVFTNLHYDDLDLSRTASRGVASLRKYLQYAETGAIDGPSEQNQGPGSTLEEVVGKRLEEKGYEVAYRVGTSGFFVDLAILDSLNPGEYLMGIEFDGSQYHETLSARDRDRLRQLVLERKGWRLHRIWSTDWFMHTDREMSRLLNAIDQAKLKRAQPSTPVAAEVTPPIVVRHLATEKPTINVQAVPALPPYELASTDFYYRWSGSAFEDIPEYEIENTLVRIVDVEGPVHVEEVIRRVARSFGANRAGNRIRERILEIILESLSVLQRGNFIYAMGNRPIVARSREGLPAESRNMEYVAPEEIQLVATKIAGQSFGIGEDALCREVVSQFGFNRTTQQMQDYVMPILKMMVKEGVLVQANGAIRVPATLNHG